MSTDLRVCLFVIISAFLIGVQEAEAVKFNGIEVIPATAVTNVSGGLCDNEAEVRFNEDTGKSEWNAHDAPDFNYTYKFERDLLLDRQFFITTALVWDNRNLSGDWLDLGSHRVPRNGTYYAYNRTQVDVPNAAEDFVTGTVDLGKITNKTWVVNSSMINGLNHTGTFRMVVMVRSTEETTGFRWRSDSDWFDTAFAVGVTCISLNVGQRVGYLRSHVNVTSFRTSNITFASEERRFMRGETVYFEFNLSANATMPTQRSDWPAVPPNITLQVFNSSGHEVFRSPLNINTSNTTFRTRWTMPEDAALQDYNVTLNVSTWSGLLSDSSVYTPWTNFTSTGVGFINKTHSEIPTQTGLDPAGTSTRRAAFWVNSTLKLIMDSGYPRPNDPDSTSPYFNRGEEVIYSFVVRDGWGRPFGGRYVRVDINSTTSDCFLNGVTLNTSGGTGVITGFILNDCEDTYASTTPGVAETKDYAFHVHFPFTTTDPLRGSYGENKTPDVMLDVDSQFYFFSDAITFDHIMRGDTNRFTATIRGVRNTAVTDGTSVTMRLYNPVGTKVYETNMRTTGGTTANWDRSFANSDAVGVWKANYTVIAANLTYNFNNSMAETTTGSTFRLNNTIIVNASSNIENNPYGEVAGTVLKVYNRNESINVTGRLYHSDGGFYRIKRPTGDTSRTITVQVFNNTYGTDFFENTSVSVASTTGLFSASVRVPTGVTNLPPNDTYVNSNPGVSESREYDIRFYDGGTSSSNANGNDANTTNQLDVDAQYYVNVTNFTPARQFNRGGPSVQVNYRLVGARGQFISSGIGGVRVRDPVPTVRGYPNVTFNDGWINATYSFTTDDRLGSWSTQAVNHTGSGGNEFTETTSNAFNLTDELTVTITNYVENYNTTDQGTTVNTTTDMAVRVLYANGTAAANLVFPAWFNRSFEYRQNVTIDNTKNNRVLVNYTVNLNFNSSKLILEGKLRADLGDLRFVDEDGTELPWWNETPANTTNTSVWVRVPRIQGSAKKNITMYYGFPSATGLYASGTKTFDYFNDFSTGGITASCGAVNNFTWNAAKKVQEYSFDQTDENCGDLTGTLNFPAFAARAVRFLFDGTTVGAGGVGATASDIKLDVHLVNTTTANYLQGAGINNPATLANRIDVRAEKQDADLLGLKASAYIQRSDKVQEIYEVAYNETHLILSIYNATNGTLISTNNVNVNDIPNRNVFWDQLRLKKASIPLATDNNRYLGFIDNLFARNYTVPEPTTKLVGAEELENATRNITLTLQNRTPIAAIKHDHVFTSTNATGYFTENDYTFTDKSDNGTWRANVTVIYLNNTGNTSVLFNVSVPVAAAPGPSILLNIRDLRTFNTNLEPQDDFEEEENVTIRANVTHPVARTLIDDVLVNITSANGTKVVNLTQMVQLREITIGLDQGYEYEFNYTIPTGADEGEWTIDVFANSTDLQTATAQRKFDVVVFRTIDIVIRGSEPHTLRIGSQRRVRKGGIPVAGG